MQVKIESTAGLGDEDDPYCMKTLTKEPKTATPLAKTKSEPLFNDAKQPPQSSQNLLNYYSDAFKAARPI